MSIKTKLQHSLRELLHRDRGGSYAGRFDRRGLLNAFVVDVNKLGYNIVDVHSLKRKHVEAVVVHWKNQQLSNSTIKNRLSAVRRLAEFINRKYVVPSNKELEIGPRKYYSLTNRAVVNPDLSKITDKHIYICIQLQRLFGLRREESLKIRPHVADQKDELVLLSSWCKGGRGRKVPIRTEEQRFWLDESKKFANRQNGSLIPESKKYITQRYLYDRQVSRAGLRNLHGLRHAYAQARYKEMTGWDAPINGGPTSKQLTEEQKEADFNARINLSEELGHGRTRVTISYLGH